MWICIQPEQKNASTEHDAATTMFLQEGVLFLGWWGATFWPNICLANKEKKVYPAPAAERHPRSMILPTLCSTFKAFTEQLYLHRE